MCDGLSRSLDCMRSSSIAELFKALRTLLEVNAVLDFLLRFTDAYLSPLKMYSNPYSKLQKIRLAIQNCTYSSNVLLASTQSTMNRSLRDVSTENSPFLAFGHRTRIPLTHTGRFTLPNVHESAENRVLQALLPLR